MRGSAEPHEAAASPSIGPVSRIVGGPVFPQGMEVAFGLSPYLHQFALDRGAAPYWKWAQEGITQQPTVPRNMHKAMEEVTQKVMLGQITQVYFNLDGISDPVASADSAAQGLAYQQAA